jgi:diguanylate cyclase (GGDEF)-like protein/PAS domain S-box-containing protein
MRRERQTQKNTSRPEAVETGRKQTDGELRASEVRYRRLFGTAEDGIFIIDGASGKIEDVNPFLLEMLGYSRDETIGKLLWQIGAFKDMKRSKAAFEKLQQDNFIRYDNMPLETKGGKPFAVEFIFNAYLVNKRRVIQCNIRDITEREELKDKLRGMATHDSLTGLPNRTLLYDRFDIALANAQRNKKIFALMSLDLDKFKDVNDTFGHDIGDRVLVAAASRLTGILRKVDTVARIGGDEFILLLWGISERDDAIKVARKIIEVFQQRLIIDEHNITITVSIGIVIFPEDGKDIKELLRKSDESLYLAKASGRNCYRSLTS